MNLKKKIRKSALVAAMAAALIAGTPHPSFSELSKSDRIKVTEIERRDPEKYKYLVEKSKSIESMFEAVEGSLKKLEKKKSKSVLNSYNAFVSLFDDLKVLDKTVYFSMRELRFKTGLRLEDSEDKLEELYGSVFDLMIEYGGFCHKEWEKKTNLTESERNMAHKLIDLLEEYKEKRSAKNLAKHLKALLAENVSRRFP